jgi:PPK2 family polyphosphate:nucleotide phosphotransferase
MSHGMDFKDKLVVPPGKKLHLKDRDPDYVGGYTKDTAALEVVQLREKLEHLQDVLYAEHKRSLLIVLQAMDAGGKDGTIKHVMSGVNPQGCDVVSFKQPTQKDLDHDFLWRVHPAAPPKGMITIFNRSHYEDVLVVRVHNLVPEDVWRKRYAYINSFEELLADSETVILKFFLHISKDEQRRRFDQRGKDPDKNWKSSAADETERKFWDEYQSAYQDALEKTSKKHAPWFVIPANAKWFRDLAISQVLVKTLEDLNLQYPRPAKATPKKAGKR